MSAKTPFELFMEQAQEMARAFPAMEAFTPKGFEKLWGTMPKDMMEIMFGNTLNEGGLDARTRLLLTLAGLTMQGAQNDVGIRQTVRHALEAGATAQEVADVMRISRWTVDRMRRSGELPAVPFGPRCFRYRPTDVADLIVSRCA